MTSGPSERPQRSDAARNRAALVAAAADAFREEGLGVSVNEVARRAGVNVATLYRNFPTKEHLVDAVLDGIVEPLRTSRDHALAHAPPGAVLGAFMVEAVRLQGEHRGLVEALTSQPSGIDVRSRLRGPAFEIVTPIVEAAHASGELRADYDAQDVLIVLRMLSMGVVSAEGAGREMRRYVDFALRGLR